MNADEVQADQTGESQPVVCEECRKSQTNHHGPCPHWNDQKKINEQFAKCLPGMLQDMAEVIMPGSLEFLEEAAPEQTFGPSQAEFIRQATKHARQTPAGGPTVENPWMKAERLEKELGAAMEALTNERQVSSMCRVMEKEILELRDARQSLEKQLEEMRQYIRGEGWKKELDEANAAYKSLQKDRDLWHIAAKRWIVHASKLQNDLQIAKFEAADLKLLLAEAKSIEKSKEFSRNWHFVSICAVLWVAIGVAVAVSLKFLQ